MFRRALPFVLIVMIAVCACTLSAVDAHAQTRRLVGETDYLRRGATYTVLAPLASMTFEGRSLGLQAIYAAEITAAGADIALNGESDWRVRGFPVVEEVRLHAVRRDNRRRTVEVEYRGREKFFKFRHPMDLDTNTAMAHLVSAAGSTADRTIARVQTLLAEITDHVFQGQLSSVPPQLRPRMMELATQKGGGIGVRAVEYRGNTFFGVELSNDGVVYNTLQVNQPQRVSRLISERVLVLLKAFAVAAREADGLYGVAINFDILSQDFLNRTATAVESVWVYADSTSIEAFDNDDITSQEFIDRCFVIVDGNRVKVDLSLQ